MTEDLRGGALHGEHVLLGASFSAAEHADVARVGSYALESTQECDVILADLTGAAYLLVSGPDAPRFCSAVFAGKELAVGETALEAVLNGTGELISTPLLTRTGDGEYVVIDASPRQDALVAWVRFLAQTSSGGQAAFPDLVIEDATSMLVPLLLSGPAAAPVLEDYLHGGAALPPAGEVAQLHLDSIATVVAHVAVAFAPPAYLVLVPVGAARVLWRSLLSFTEVAPVGHDRIAADLRNAFPWFGSELEGGPTQMGRSELERWGVVRAGSDFVGARALD